MSSHFAVASPAWLEERLERALNRFADILFRIPRPVWFGTALAFSALLAAMNVHAPWREWWFTHNPFGFSFLGFHWPGVMTLLLLGLFLPNLPLGLHAACTVFAYLLARPYDSTVVSLTAGIILSYALPLLLMTLLKHFKLQLQLAAQVFAAIGTMILLQQLSGWGFIDNPDRGWWGFRPERFAMVTILVIAWRTGSAKPVGDLLLSPLHLVYSLPVLHLDKRASDFSRTHKSGLLLMMLALVSLGAGALTRSFSTYLYFYFNSWAVLSLVVGLARWLGYSLPAPFHFALTAVSPAQSWRRWNIPFYEWFQGLVFGPIYRKTKSAFLAVFTTFAVSFWLHDGISALDLWHGSASQEVDFWVRNKILFFGWHAAGVYVSLITSKYWPDRRHWSGWLGVIATWAWMSWVHTFVLGY